VRYILDSANSLSELVNDLLDLAKIEAGKVEIQPGRFQVAELFSALRGMLRPLLVSDKLHLSFVAPEDCEMETDEGKLADPAQLHFQCHQVHRAGQHHRDGRAAATTRGALQCDRQRYRHRARAHRHHLRRIRPGGKPPATPRQGHRTGPAAVPPAGYAVGRIGRRDQYAGAGRDLQRRDPDGPSAESVRPCTWPRRQCSRVPNRTLPACRCWCWKTAPNCACSTSATCTSPEFRMVPATSVAEAEALWRNGEPCAVILDLLLDGKDAWHWLVQLKNDPARCDVPIIVSDSTTRARPWAWARMRISRSPWGAMNCWPPCARWWIRAGHETKSAHLRSITEQTRHPAAFCHPRHPCTP
jgi:hypothetical protein